jgi:hypothetical protein
MSKKFTIKRIQTDDWARFLFNEMRKDEKRPIGKRWMDLKQIYELSKDKAKYYTLRNILSEIINRKECEIYSGTTRSHKGFVKKTVWYRHKKYGWKEYFSKNIYKLERQRLPKGTDWFTMEDISKKTGLARSKILRLIREHKLNKNVKTFDGYKFNPSKNYLERKIWYKLCLNG